MPAIHWFRRDLRAGDNPALAAAGPDAVGVFIHDPRLASVGAVRRRYLDEALAELGEHCRLLIRHGDPAAVLRELAEEVGTTQVFCTDDTTAFARRRDDAVASSLADQGITLRRVDTPYAVPPGEVRNGSGNPYRVFTPFYKAWLARTLATGAGHPGAAAVAGVPGRGPSRVQGPPRPARAAGHQPAVGGAALRADPPPDSAC